MNYGIVNSCYFPTTVLLIDDNQRYLANVSLKLAADLNYRLIDRPELALSYLRNDKIAKSFMKRYYDTCKHAHLEAEDDYVNISTIHRELYNCQRFDEASVILVDYAMPSMNGLEFCQAISNLPVKKALVTGQADQSIAIDAFNAGIIDKFIVKDSPNFFNLINDTITELQQTYFRDLSTPLLDEIGKNSNNCLKDSNFQQLFQQLCNDHDIIEYYLIEPSGSYLMLDKKGRVFWLIVKSASEMAAYTDIAKDNDAPATVVAALEQHQSLPFFFNEKDHDAPVSEWDNYLHPAQALDKQANFYYTFIEDKNNDKYSLPSSEIVWYQDFISRCEK